MPIYEYRCGACGHHLEALQKMSEGPLRKCPDCGKSQLRRLMSAPQFRLKGEGWYETDFKSKNEVKRNLVEATAESGAEAKSGDAKEAPAKADADKAATAAKPDGADKSAASDKPARAKNAAPAGKRAAKTRASKPARA